MKKLPLYCKGSDWLRSYHEVKDFSRKYSSITIVDCDEWNNGMEVFRVYGADLRVVQFQNCKFDSEHAGFLNELLSSLKKLEELRLSQTSIDFKTFKSHSLPHLKSVVLDRGGCEVSRT